MDEETYAYFCSDPSSGACPPDPLSAARYVPKINPVRFLGQVPYVAIFEGEGAWGI